MCCFEQILGAVPYKTAVVWQFTSHLTNNPSKMTKIYMLGTAGEVRINNILLKTSTHRYTNVGQLAKTDIHQLCANTDCCLEDLPRAMCDRDELCQRNLCCKHNLMMIRLHRSRSHLSTSSHGSSSKMRLRTVSGGIVRLSFGSRDAIFVLHISVKKMITGLLFHLARCLVTLLIRKAW